MKIVMADFIFSSIPYEVAEAIGCSRYDDDIAIRTDSRLIDWLENSYERGCGLHIIEIPDNVTDYDIFYDEDGAEYVVAVIDGKLATFF